MTSKGDMLPVLVHFSADDQVLRKHIGCPVTHDWVIASNSREGLGRACEHGVKSLLCSVVGCDTWDGVPQGFGVSFSDLQEREREALGLERSTLTDYASALLKSVSNKLGKMDGQFRVVLGLNLLGFNVVGRHVDQVVTALEDFLEKNPRVNASQNAVVFLMRNLEEIAPAYKEEVPPLLANFVERDDRLIKICAFGYEERGVCFIDRVDDSGYLPWTRVKSGDIRGALDVDRHAAEEELVFRSNMQIGHFDMGKSHVRTHYNIGRFIQRDFVRELFFEEMLSVVGDNRKRRACIVIAGIHQTALRKAADDLSSIARTVRRVLEADDLDNEVFREYIKSCSVVVVLADMVNTGAALGEWVRRIRELRTASDIEIKLYAIARMANSPKIIESLSLNCLVTVNRNYYSPDDCPLCRVNQPVSNGGKTVSTSGGFANDDRQLTAYDFWETVGERSALVFSKDCNSGRFSAYVSTVSGKTGKQGLADRYQEWLKGLIRDRLRGAGIQSGRIDLIVTVDEPSGVQFARLVASALDLGEKSIEYVPRNYKNKEGLKGRLGSVGNVSMLLADDGINTGSTFRMLSEYCGSCGTIEGGIVFDNRLSESNLNDLVSECRLARVPIALYHWRMNSDIARPQLREMIRLWDGSTYSYDPLGTMLDFLGREDITLDQLFKLNDKLYANAFANARVLSKKDRVAFLDAAGLDGMALTRMQMPNVQKEFPVLAEAAQTLLEQRTGIRVSPSVRRERVGASPAALVAKKKNPRGFTWDDLTARIAPIVCVKEPNEPIGTGFFIKIVSTGALNGETLLVTCEHVFDKLEGVATKVLIDQAFYEINKLFSFPSDSVKDVELLRVKEIPEDTEAFLKIGRSPCECDASPFHSCGYTREKKLNPVSYQNLRSPSFCGQSGHVQMKYKSKCAKVSKGTSGSPVVDNEGLLVGMVKAESWYSKNIQTITVVPASRIQEAVDKCESDLKRRLE